jgi:hypothetical protein
MVSFMPRAGLHNVEKRKILILPGLELLPLGRPARSQSLYRLRYLGSIYLINTSKNRIFYQMSIDETPRTVSQQSIKMNPHTLVTYYNI